MGTYARHLFVGSLDVNVLGKVKCVSTDGSPNGDVSRDTSSWGPWMSMYLARSNVYRPVEALMGTYARHLFVGSLDVNVLGKVKCVSTGESSNGDVCQTPLRGVPGCQCIGQGQMCIDR